MLMGIVMDELKYRILRGVMMLMAASALLSGSLAIATRLMA